MSKEDIEAVEVAPEKANFLPEKKDTKGALYGLFVGILLTVLVGFTIRVAIGGSSSGASDSALAKATKEHQETIVKLNTELQALKSAPATNPAFEEKEETSKRE